jgi:hypothetical protein
VSNPIPDDENGHYLAELDAELGIVETSPRLRMGDSSKEKKTALNKNQKIQKTQNSANTSSILKVKSSDAYSGHIESPSSDEEAYYLSSWHNSSTNKTGRDKHPSSAPSTVKTTKHSKSNSNYGQPSIDVAANIGSSSAAWQSPIQTRAKTVKGVVSNQSIKRDEKVSSHVKYVSNNPSAKRNSTDNAVLFNAYGGVGNFYSDATAAGSASKRKQMLGVSDSNAKQNHSISDSDLEDADDICVTSDDDMPPYVDDETPYDVIHSS